MRITKLIFEQQSLTKTVYFHGWPFLEPFTWDGVNKILSVPFATAEAAAHLDFIDQSDRILVRIATQNSDRKIIEAAIRAAEYMLARDLAFEPFIKKAKKLRPSLARFVLSGGGRFIRGATPFEDTIKTVLTTNASWGFTRTMAQRLVSHYGQSIMSPIGKRKAFPTAKKLMLVSENELREKARVGYRASWIKKIASYFHLKGNASAWIWPPLTELESLPGIGEYSLNHLSFLSGRFDQIPFDSEVKLYLREKGFKNETNFEKALAGWGEYKFLAYKLGRVVRKDNWVGEPED